MLTVSHIHKSYVQGHGLFSAKTTPVLTDVCFDIDKGKCLGLVGPSGSGKSTLTRIILGLEAADSGQVTWNGQPMSAYKKHKGLFSVVFQDYLASVNPAMTVQEIVLEALEITGMTVYNKRQRCKELLETVNLPSHYATKYPHELSGGQLQRLCIARAVTTRPQFIILDEPTSSLDTVNQFHILKLLHLLQCDLKITYLFISHDLQAITYLSDEVIFFDQGQVIERVPVQHIGNVQSATARSLVNVARLSHA